MPFYEISNKNITVHYVLVYAMSKDAHQAAAADITTCLKAGFLSHLIAQRFLLSEIAAAHDVVDSGRTIGNIVVEIQN